QPDVEPELYAYLATACKTADSPALLINGTADHIHLLVKLGRKTSIANLIEDIKSSSSRWIKTKGPRYKGFYWQAGYGAFSIGQSQVATVKRYIANQKEHH